MTEEQETIYLQEICRVRQDLERYRTELAAAHKGRGMLNVFAVIGTFALVILALWLLSQVNLEWITSDLMWSTLILGGGGFFFGFLAEGWAVKRAKSRRK